MWFICYSQCSTCKKAQQWLDERGVSYHVRDIKADRPSYAELKHWHRISGLPLKSFFNTSGKRYRELNLKDRLPEMSDEEKLKLLATDGMLVKRPILVGDDYILLGFKPSEWKERVQ